MKKNEIILLKCWLTPVEPQIDYGFSKSTQAKMRMQSNSSNPRWSIMNAATYSECKGVHWDKCRSKWFAKIHINGTSLFLGRFKDFDDAVEAREKAEATISLLRDVNATNIHILNVGNGNKVVSAILPKNGFNFKFEIQLDLPRTRNYSVVGGVK